MDWNVRIERVVIEPVCSRRWPAISLSDVSVMMAACGEFFAAVLWETATPAREPGRAAPLRPLTLITSTSTSPAVSHNAMPCKVTAKQAFID